MSKDSPVGFFYPPANKFDRWEQVASCDNPDAVPLYLKSVQPVKKEDTISKCKLIMRLIDQYIENPTAKIRTDIRCALIDSYAAPVSAKREWVELTDDEFQKIKNSLSRQHGWDGDGWDLALKEAVIAAFKEKNK